MQYQSIIRFFDYSGIEYSNVNEFNLSRAKKLITAEFAMQPDGIIVIDKFSYTKQEILSELEQPDFLERLGFHQIIWQRKGLLALLEQDTFSFHDGGTWFSLYKTPGFVSFVSSYFAEAYNRIMRSLLNDHDLSSAAVWLDYLHFIEPEDEEIALRNTRIYLNETIRFFRNLNDQSYKSRDNELRIWYTTSWSPFINKLPDSLLSYVDDIVSAIINFSVRIQKSSRKICYKISKELLNVNNANYTLIQLVRSNHEAYKQNYKGKSLTGWLKSGVNIVYVIMILLFGISKLFMSDSGDSDSYDNSYFQNSDADQNDVKAYKKVRELYRSNHGQNRNELFKTMVKTSDAFDAKEMYLLIEGVNDSSKALSPLTIRNGTDQTIQLHMLRSDNVYHFDIESEKFLSFAPLLSQSMDMFFELGNHGDIANIPFNANDRTPYLHIGPQNQEHDRNYAFKDTESIELPYFEEAELSKKVPLIIDIKKKEGRFYFYLTGRGNIVFQKGADVNVSMK